MHTHTVSTHAQHNAIHVSQLVTAWLPFTVTCRAVFTTAEDLDCLTDFQNFYTAKELRPEVCRGQAKPTCVLATSHAQFELQRSYAAHSSLSGIQ